MRNQRLSDKVAEMMLQTILERGLMAGDKLPSEREIGEQFGVSRTVVREAVRSLAARGLIEARPGSGLSVAAVEASAVSSTMSLYLRGGSELHYDKIHEVRVTIEVQTARLAAERADTDALRRMRVAFDALMDAIAREDLAAAAQSDVAFHEEIARATNNELFIIMLDSIGDLLLEIRHRTMALPGDFDVAKVEHRAILDAIEARDPDAAERAMRHHLDDADQQWRALGPVVRSS